MAFVSMFVNNSNRVKYPPFRECAEYNPFYNGGILRNPFFVYSVGVSMFGMLNKPLIPSAPVVYPDNIFSVKTPSNPLVGGSSDIYGFGSLSSGIFNYSYPYSNSDLSSNSSIMLSDGVLFETPATRSKGNVDNDVYTTLHASHLNKEFLNKVKSVAKNINCDYEDLLAVMNSESGLDPSKWNASRTAVGLIQFTNSAVAELNKTYGMNITKEQIAKLSAMEQLDLVEKYFKAVKRYHFKSSDKLSAADLYAMTYLPGRSGRDVLCRKGERTSSGRLRGYYEGNSSFDKNGDGVITKDELNVHLKTKRVSLSTFA